MADALAPVANNGAADEVSQLDRIERQLAELGSTASRLDHAERKLAELGGTALRLDLFERQLADLSDGAPRVDQFDHKLLELIRAQYECRDRLNFLVSSHSVYMGEDTTMTWLNEGHPFFVDTRDRGAGLNYLRMGGDEPWNKHQIVSNLKPNSSFVDIGANHGYFTILAGQTRLEGLRVHAFEPNPRMRELLFWNCRLNALADFVQIYGLALSDSCGEGELAWNSDFPGGGALSLKDHHPTTKTEVIKSVPVATLDSVYRDSRPISVMKIDAEGAEFSIMNGMRETSAASADCTVILEWLPPILFNESSKARGAPASFGEAFDFLSSFGKSISIISRSGDFETIPVKSAADLDVPVADLLLR